MPVQLNTRHVDQPSSNPPEQPTAQQLTTTIINKIHSAKEMAVVSSTTYLVRQPFATASLESIQPSVTATAFLTRARSSSWAESFSQVITTVSMKVAWVVHSPLQHIHQFTRIDSPDQTNRAVVVQTDEHQYKRPDDALL